MSLLRLGENLLRTYPLPAIFFCVWMILSLSMIGVGLYRVYKCMSNVT